MFLRLLSGLGLLGVVVGVGALLVGPAAGQAPEQPARIPSAGEVADLLRREPFSPKSWPTWRGRLLSWLSDRTSRTDSAFLAARAFMHEQAGDRGQLPPPLDRDALAWYLLGSYYLSASSPQSKPAQMGARAEAALRRSLALDSSFARAHRNLAVALLLQQHDKNAGQQEVYKALEQARRLDSTLPLKGIEGRAAMRREQFGNAENFFREALVEEPDNVGNAHGLAAAIVFNRSRSGERAEAVRRLVERFPDDGYLVCLYAVALASDERWGDAARELQHARDLGTDPGKVLPPAVVATIEEKAAPSYLELFGWCLAWLVVFYAGFMLLMVLVGVVLARRTQGSRALELLGARPDSLVAAGQVVRARHELLLSRLYGLSLVASLVLFYLAIPFVIAGLLVGTGLLLYLIFHLRRVPVKLVALVAVAGLGGAWAVFKSLFASPGQGSFGLPRTAEECPRLHQLLAEVAGRVDTDAVHEVYLAPGSSIGVHQEGRGPFGMFGVKRRVLTLGLSTLRFLTVDELKAILAHEYAHFSHKDTFYSRFIYQVDLSIHQALNGLAESGGYFNYVNPFYWFLFLYYRAYSVLSAGFSRSREFLADRMASSLYGSDVFASALTKVCTDGTLFEMTMYDGIADLLREGKAFVNMYDAFRSFRDEHLAATDREELYKKLLDEKASLLASHPTFGERIAAVAALPRAETTDSTPALSLFDNAEEVEQELTDFLTGYIQYVQEMQAQQAQAEAAQ